ncbi:hypothetical protein RB195_000092 [Necator americanus]|uniref:Uncharacterized protein n=1 Tax=Necator americanus TaxID=51031 RepID=A0ABR1DAX1_NECAM
MGWRKMRANSPNEFSGLFRSLQVESRAKIRSWRVEISPGSSDTTQTEHFLLLFGAVRAASAGDVLTPSIVNKISHRQLISSAYLVNRSVQTYLVFRAHILRLCSCSSRCPLSRRHNGRWD